MDSERKELIEKIKKHKGLGEFQAQLSKVLNEFEGKMNEIKKKCIFEFRKEVMGELEKYADKLNEPLVDENDERNLRHIVDFDALELADLMEAKCKRIVKILRKK